MTFEIDEEAFLEAIRPAVQARAEIALGLWHEYPRKQAAPGYPFEATRTSPPTLDVDRVPGGFELTIRGPQVDFFEHGNGPGLIRPKRKPKLVVSLAAGGVAQLDYVKPYEGTNAWFKSVEKAFLFL